MSNSEEKIMEKNINKLKQSKVSKPSSVSINDKNKLLAVIRISGMVKVKKDMAETLDRLRLRRKYACVLIDGSDKNLIGMIEKIKFYVAYGSVDKETLIKLVKERGKSVDGKNVDAEKVAFSLMKGEKLSNLGLKPFFRLHSPREGIKSKLQYPRGVLGNNDRDVNKLIMRML